MRKNSILTFDYELFLGLDSGTAKKSIIEPTDKIIKILKQYNAKAIFFVDATYLMTLKRYDSKDFNLISKQLKEIVSIGSSVELHLHPQWLDAKPDGDRWNFTTFDKYRLHSLSQKEINKLFQDGINILEDITNQKVRIFRAGGWSITPFSKLKKAFIQNNIKIDMSVLRGFKKDELPMHYYDFLDAPKKELYRFEDEVVIESEKGSFLEIPVTTFKMQGIHLVINNIINKFNKEKYFGDGKGLLTSGISENIIKRIFSKNLRKATIENQSYYMFRKSLNSIRDRKLLSYVMHPKTLSKTSLKNFEYLTENYETLNSDDLLRIYF